MNKSESDRYNELPRARRPCYSKISEASQFLYSYAADYLSIPIIAVLIFAGLAKELTDHLEYDPYFWSGFFFIQSRNNKYSISVTTLFMCLNFDFIPVAT
jgi:hypothetical protein